MGYQHTNAKGVTYYLNSKEVALNGGKNSRIYYFSRDERPEAAEMPEDREVGENAKTGMLFLRKKK